MTATTAQIAAILGDGLKVTTGYGEMLVRDIPAEKFGHMPYPNMNHPAFCLGHLTLYPNRALSMLDRSDCVIDLPGYEELFEGGVPCVEQDGRYPEKDELIERYLERHRMVEKALSEVDEDVFVRENPIEGRLKEMFPTVGSAVNFLLNNHQMMHLGQVSAWRRVMGLPAVM